MPWVPWATFSKKAIRHHIKSLGKKDLHKAGSATRSQVMPPYATLTLTLTLKCVVLQLLRQEIELKKLELEELKAQLENAVPQLKAFSEEERDNMAMAAHDEEHGEEETLEYHQRQAAKVCAAHYPLITNHYSLLDLECTRSQTSDGEGKCMVIG